MNAAKIVDGALEASVLGSFSKIGYIARQRLDGWTTPAPMTGRSVVVTGATSGIGLACAHRFASLGASVYIVGRDPTRVATSREQVVRSSGNDAVEGAVADVSDLGAVREVAQWLVERTSHVDVLVHNAGALSRERLETSDGTEMTVASQLLGPFLLTGLLLERIERAAPGRVITVSSGGLYGQRFDLDGLEMEPGEYDGVRAYARTKRAQVVLTHEWARRIAPTSAVFHAMHPGWVDTPGLRESLPTFATVMGPLLRTVDQGADTIVWLASAPEAVRSSGELWLDRRPRSEYKVPGTRSQRPASDQRRLWEWCCARTGWSLPSTSSR